MSILFIVGRKKAGKTTLVEKLLSGLRDRGHKLGSIKHTSHNHEFDREGTDSFRHAKAGAETTLILSPHKIALFSESMKNRDFHQLLDFIFTDCDLIIGEGFKESPFPKIEVLGSGKDAGPTCGPQDNLLAVVADKKTELSVPHFKMDQVVEIIDFVEKKFLKENTDKECR